MGKKKPNILDLGAFRMKKAEASAKASEQDAEEKMIAHVNRTGLEILKLIEDRQIPEEFIPSLTYGVFSHVVVHLAPPPSFLVEVIHDLSHFICRKIRNGVWKEG